MDYKSIVEAIVLCKTKTEIRINGQSLWLKIGEGNISFVRSSTSDTYINLTEKECVLLRDALIQLFPVELEVPDVMDIDNER